jgi:hypothetical protein
MCLKELSDGGMCTIGQVVRSRKGKDAGRWYVVVGVSEDCPTCAKQRGRRVLVADGTRYTAARPKAKNTIHLQRTRWILDEIAHGILSKRTFDAGRFQALLKGLAEKNSIGEFVGRTPEHGAHGASSREDEETACPTKTK